MELRRRVSDLERQLEQQRETNTALEADKEQLETCLVEYKQRLNVRFSKILSQHEHTGWAKKTGLFLRVDNFATVSGREACNMSKVCKFYLEKRCKTCMPMRLNIFC